MNAARIQAQAEFLSAGVQRQGIGLIEPGREIIRKGWIGFRQQGLNVTAVVTPCGYAVAAQSRRSNVAREELRRRSRTSRQKAVAAPRR